jgi:hypothetical protein
MVANSNDIAFSPEKWYLLVGSLRKSIFGLLSCSTYKIILILNLKSYRRVYNELSTQILWLKVNHLFFD